MESKGRFKKFSNIYPWLSMTDKEINKYCGMWVVLNTDEDGYYYVNSFYDYREAQELANKINGYYSRF